MEGEEAERMVLVGAQQKELGVALMMVVLRGQEEAEAGVAQVESLVETEVNHPLHPPKMHALHVYQLFICWLLSHKFTMKECKEVPFIFT